MTDELAIKLLNQAEELIGEESSQESLISTLSEAEQLSSRDAAVLCRSARVLFRFAIFNEKRQCFLLALDKLKEAEEREPHFFETTPVWCQLWGNILVQLGKLIDEPSFFELALQKYKKASQIAGNKDPDIFWDMAEAWAFLGQKSQEPADFQNSLINYSKASRLGLTSPFFSIDYSQALVSFAVLDGNPGYVEDAIGLCKNVIHENYGQEDARVAYLVAWRKLALAGKLRYQLSPKVEIFDEADGFFKEAILANPKNGDLWLDWCELYLFSGWIRRDLKSIEAGIEKLTTTKVKECDPLRVSLLLGLALSMLGLFLENLKLLKEGQERLRNALQILPDNPELIYAAAFADFALGLYFSEPEAFAKAAAIFEKGTQEDSVSVQNWHALFQVYLAWGLKNQDPYLVQKGVAAVARVSELRPFSSVHLNEWGTALLRLRNLTYARDKAQLYVEEAIDKFCRAYELSEEDETLFNWGCALDLLGDLTGDEEDYAKAIDLLTKVYEKKSSETTIRYHLGLAFSHLGELTLNADCLTQAAELLESVAKVDPEDENVWCDLGYTLLNLSQIMVDSLYPQEHERVRNEAERALLRAAELGSGDACYHLGCLYSISGHLSASMTYLRKAALLQHLPSKEDLENDEWLEGVKNTDDFQDFLTTQGENG